MKYLELLITFFKIGAFSFGGGYAMIPFFEKEIVIHHWSAASDYTKVIAIAQIFPGPFAVDSSAYIGYKAAGILGAIVATIGICLPSFIAFVYITRRYMEFKANCYIQMLLGGVRPVVIGLLISATYIIGFKPVIGTWGDFTHSLLGIKAVLLIVAGFLLLKYTKVNPVFFIVLFGIVGVVLF
jgi:chromate transporter